jgi:hypothetical protein
MMVLKIDGRIQPTIFNLSAVTLIKIDGWRIPI